MNLMTEQLNRDMGLHQSIFRISIFLENTDRMLTMGKGNVMVPVTIKKLLTIQRIC